MKGRFTLSYGLAYTLDLPPYEINGKQVGLVDQSGKPIVLTDFLAQKQKAALAGQVYNPTVGYATVRNMKPSLKYPFDPFYGGRSRPPAASRESRCCEGRLCSDVCHTKNAHNS